MNKSNQRYLIHGEKEITYCENLTLIICEVGWLADFHGYWQSFVYELEKNIYLIIHAYFFKIHKIYYLIKLKEEYSMSSILSTLIMTNELR